VRHDVLEERLGDHERVEQEHDRLHRHESHVASGAIVVREDGVSRPFALLDRRAERVASEDGPSEHALGAVGIVADLARLERAADRLSERCAVTTVVDRARLAELAVVQEVGHVTHREGFLLGIPAPFPIARVEEVHRHRSRLAVALDHRQLLTLGGGVDAVDQHADHGREPIELGDELLELALLLAEITREDFYVEVGLQLLIAFLHVLGVDHGALESVTEDELEAALERLLGRVERGHRELEPHEGLVVGHGNLHVRRSGGDWTERCWLNCERASLIPFHRNLGKNLGRNASESEVYEPRRALIIFPPMASSFQTRKFGGKASLVTARSSENQDLRYTISGIRRCASPCGS